MRKIFRKIEFFILGAIWWYLVRPVKKFVNYYIHGRYIENNEHNRQVIEYCRKVIRDPDYEPSTPLEHWVDAEWQRSSRDLYDQKRAEGLIGEDVPYNYHTARPYIARSIMAQMAEIPMRNAA